MGNLSQKNGQVSFSQIILSSASFCFVNHPNVVHFSENYRCIVQNMLVGLFEYRFIHSSTVLSAIALLSNYEQPCLCYRINLFHLGDTHSVISYFVANMKRNASDLPACKLKVDVNQKFILDMLLPKQRENF